MPPNKAWTASIRPAKIGLPTSNLDGLTLVNPSFFGLLVKLSRFVIET
jgi:hypothetical protein